MLELLCRAQQHGVNLGHDAFERLLGQDELPPVFSELVCQRRFIFFSGFLPVGLKCQTRAESALYQENLVPLVTANLPFLIRKVLDEPFSQEIPRPVVLQQTDQELLIVLPILRAEHRETARQPLQPRQRGCGGVLRVLLYVSHFDVLSRCENNLGGF